jgi:hypothetical protein
VPLRRESQQPARQGKRINHHCIAQPLAEGALGDAAGAAAPDDSSIFANNEFLESGYPKPEMHATLCNAPRDEKASGEENWRRTVGRAVRIAFGQAELPHLAPQGALG